MDGVRYFCPLGIELPMHARPLSPNRIVAGHGPDAAKGGGMLFGGAPDWSLNWCDSGAGWWYACDGVELGNLLRVDAIPGLAVGAWIVPTLMRMDGTSVVGYWSATGFTVPDPYAHLLERLRAIVPDTRYGQAHAMLVADILALNYHVSIHELGGLRALTPDFIRDALRSAAGFPQQWALKQDAEVAA